MLASGLPLFSVLSTEEEVSVFKMAENMDSVAEVLAWTTNWFEIV